MPPRHHEFEIDRAAGSRSCAAAPAHAPAPASEPAHEVTTPDDTDLLPLFALLWVLCAVSVAVALVHPPFDVRATVALSMLFLLPLLVRKTIARLFARARR